MKTIFAKYNSERLPKYQIVTKIIVDDNGQKYAIKEALCDEAKEHIEDIYNNYGLLKKIHNLNLVKPTKMENGVIFEMAKGISLESILLEAIAQNDKDRFIKYIDKFLNFLDEMVTKQNVIFEASEKFRTTFGEWKSNKPQDIIKVANIDLIFGNIFVDENDDFTLIDYEWVFDFEVPKDYIIWRTLSIFSAYHSIDLSKYINCFDNKENKRFLEYDDMFSSFVHGKSKKYFLSSFVKKDVNFIDLNKKEYFPKLNYFIQLFIENENEFNEKNSIKISIDDTKKVQEICFDISKINNIKNIRLDPLNESCIVHITNIFLVLKDDKIINLMENILTNSFYNRENIYFFNFSDPQIFFNDIDFSSFSIKMLKVELSYIIGKDTPFIMLNEILKDLRNKEEEIVKINDKLRNKEEEIVKIKAELSNKEILSNKLLNELNIIYSSKGWEFLEKFREMKKIFKGKK